MNKLIAACIFSLVAASCAMGHGGKAHINADENGAMNSQLEPHIVTTKSNVNFETTLVQLRAAIDSRGFKTFAVLDHAAGAASIGEELRPTTLIIFGNPQGGTALMQAEQRLGLELPLKILVTEDAQGIVRLTHTDMAYLFGEYGIAEMTTPLQNIEGALSAIVKQAGGR